jgi:hypothetical protein
MAFELMLRGTRRASPREVRNPFTGQLQTIAPLVMSEAEFEASVAVLARHGGRLDEDGGGLVRLEGAALEFSGFDEEGDLVKVIGDLHVACRVLFELAVAGQMAILPDSGDGLVTSGAALVRAQQLEQELGSPVVVVEDAEALAAALTAECDAARAYAERAVRGG